MLKTVERSPSTEPHRNDPRARRAVALICLVLAAAACSEGPNRSAPPTAGTASANEPAAEAPDVAAALDRLTAAFEPVSLTATSDVHDRALHAQRDVVEELRKRPRELGLAAWRRFQSIDPANDPLRMAMLDVASHAAPADLAGELARMVVTYESASLRVRTRALELIAKTSPEAALVELEPFVRNPRRSITLPPQEALVNAWIVASRALARRTVPALADVATNQDQPPDARYRAIEELGELGGDEVRPALELVLVESGTDGYLRRKSAQALVKALPGEQACEILLRVAGRETDMDFLHFLKDVVERTCP